MLAQSSVNTLADASPNICRRLFVITGFWLPKADILGGNWKMLALGAYGGVAFWKHTSFDVSMRVNYTSSRTASTNINSDVMIHMRIQVIMRTSLAQHGYESGRSDNYSIEACLDGLRKFCLKGRDAILNEVG